MGFFSKEEKLSPAQKRNEMLKKKRKEALLKRRRDAAKKKDGDKSIAEKINFGGRYGG